MARTLPTLVVFRVIQGFGAGALQPTEQAILRQTFPPKEQGMAMALFGMAVDARPRLRPDARRLHRRQLSAGRGSSTSTSRSACSASSWCSRFVHEPEDIRAANRARPPKQRKNMDWAGIALLCVGLATLQYVLEEGSRNDWFESRAIIALRHRRRRRAGGASSSAS